MTPSSPDPANTKAKTSKKQMARDRSAAALRENLKRRKDQARTQAQTQAKNTDAKDADAKAAKKAEQAKKAGQAQ